MATSLYNLAITAVSEYFNYFKRDLRVLPEPIAFDVYMKVYEQGSLCALGLEFCDLDVFSRILKITNRRVCLLKCFQDLLKHGTRVARELSNYYELRCRDGNLSPSQKDSVINLGLRLGSFLSEGGWFDDSSRVLTACRDLCLSLPECIESWKTTLDCCYRLLHTDVINHNIQASKASKRLAKEIVAKLNEAGCIINLSGLYTEFSRFAYGMSRYDEAFKWSRLAVFELTPETPIGITIETLSQASKACVVKREFNKASCLVRQAVDLARETYGDHHPKYADTLLDYGFYLLSSDSIKNSVAVYEIALIIKSAVFGEDNLHVAVAHEDLAYALYVFEYSNGRFNSASKHAEEAIKAMEKLLPRDHLMLASAQRVKALILEEIALDSMSDATSETQNHMLAQAEKLHKDNLRLSQLSFGEDNVHTAKHYGNLGRLYQSMKRYEEAEAMHLKAIEIKERLLGKDDYEVGLSVGHLASLYNYHMKEYRKAEFLYYKSIDINLKLFSESYSGLEYDYRGLMHVYTSLGISEKAAHYVTTMNHWKELREMQEMEESEPLAPQPPQNLQQLKELFLPE